jgi:hypothetical protein
MVFVNTRLFAIGYRGLLAFSYDESGEVLKIDSALA